jgi:biotin carboxyl carrier protein
MKNKFAVRVNDKFDFEIRVEKEKIFANEQQIILDMSKGQEQHFHILLNNKSYRAEVVTFDADDKTCSIKINGNLYTLEIQDQYDELLHRLGLDNLNQVKISELKAPMPGLVLKLFVSSGDSIKKGDNILVLEAMKMENIIKSPADGIIKSIKVTPSDKVEKNQVMVLFE